eukprot:RCo011418
MDRPPADGPPKDQLKILFHLSSPGGGEPRVEKRKVEGDWIRSSPWEFILSAIQKQYSVLAGSGSSTAGSGLVVSYLAPGPLSGGEGGGPSTPSLGEALPSSSSTSPSSSEIVVNDQRSWMAFLQAHPCPALLKLDARPSSPSTVSAATSAASSDPSKCNGGGGPLESNGERSVAVPEASPLEAAGSEGVGAAASAAETHSVDMVSQGEEEPDRPEEMEVDGAERPDSSGALGASEGSGGPAGLAREPPSPSRSEISTTDSLEEQIRAINEGLAEVPTYHGLAPASARQGGGGASSGHGSGGAE